MSGDVFDLHEDDWGMISLVPAEDRAQSERVADEARAHGEAHRAPGGIGWTEIYVAPSPSVKIEAPGLRLEALATLLGPSFRRCSGVTSGYGRTREPLPTAFAYTDGRVTFYGGFTPEEVVRGLYVDHRSDDHALEEPLLRLGRLQRLVLLDMYRDVVIDLADVDALRAYLHEQDDE